MASSADQDYARLPRMQVASGCLLTDGAGNVLLVKPAYKPPWEVPGGAAELGLERPPRTGLSSWL
jgi:hypothetical protein